jgi:hypothetical protein
MNPRTNFKLIIIQTELERFKFLVRSFLRARIKKVCYFAHGYNLPTPVVGLCKSLLPMLTKNVTNADEECFQ